MPIEIPQFWKLLLESQLLMPEQCQQLGQDYGNVKGAAQQGNARTLSEWLVSKNILSRYQATLLLAGRAGPFVYGDYKVYDLIESGRLTGMFRAVHAMTGHPVMLKFLAGDDVTDGHRLARLATRVREESEIDDPYLHRCFDLADLPDYKFLVFDDLRGETLESHLAAGRFAPPDAAYVIRCAALGLAELHRRGLVHGDIRPSNIWLEANGNLQLLRDTTRDLESYALSRSPTDEQLPRADYLAPEMATGDRNPDPLTDIYALGCTCYQLLSGKPPFAGGTVAEKLSLHAQAPIEPLEPLGVPQPVAQIVAYMMAKNPDVRYQAVGQVAEQLTSFADPARLQASQSQSPPSLASFVAYVKQQQLRQPVQQHAPAPVESSVASAGPSFDELSVAADKPLQSDEPSFEFSNSDSAKSTTKTAEEANEAYHQKKERTPKDVALIFAGVAAAIVALIVGVQFMPSGNPSNEVATNGATDVPTIDPEEPIFIDDPLGPLRPSFDKPPQPADDDPQGQSGSDDPAGAESPGIRVDIVPDNGEVLWAPPTTGPPIDFAYVPPGGQVFLIARPADMLASGEGARVLNGLGTQFDSARASWETTAGVTLDQVEQVIVSLHDNNDQFPKSCSVVRLKTAMTFDNLLAAWGNPQPIEADSSLYNVRGQVAYLPREEGGKVFVIGSLEEVKESAEFGGASPPLRREIEKLRMVSDSERHFTMMLAPNYLFSGGRAIFSGERKKLLDPVDQFLGDGLQAVMVGMQFDQEFYLEARLVSEIGTEPSLLATNMRDRMAAIPNGMENYIVSLNPHPHWKRLALRYPQMIRYMHRFTRVGAEDDHAVINTVMPGLAAHNLVTASELALGSTPGDLTVVAVNPNGAANSGSPATMGDALKVKLTIDIPQTSLEFAMRDLASDIREELPTLGKFDIVIIGPDLQLNGITRNQQIRDFVVKDKPVEEVLTALCMKANPVTTVKDPSEADQKLLWVIDPKPADPTSKIILITTRDSALAKNYTLPPAFQLK